MKEFIGKSTTVLTTTIFFGLLGANDSAQAIPPALIGGEVLKKTIEGAGKKDSKKEAVIPKIEKETPPSKLGDVEKWVPERTREKVEEKIPEGAEKALGKFGSGERPDVQKLIPEKQAEKLEKLEEKGVPVGAIKGLFN